MVTTRSPKTIVKPTALGPGANTDTKFLIYGLFQKGRVLAQDDVIMGLKITSSDQTIVKPTALGPVANTDTKLLICGLFQKGGVLAQDGVAYRRASTASAGLREF